MSNRWDGGKGPMVEVEMLISSGWCHEMIRLLGPGKYQILRCQRNLDSCSYSIYSDAWDAEHVNSVNKSPQWRAIDQRRKAEAKQTYFNPPP